MAKYMIHACKQRMWYVNDYLVPSMLKQGIDKDNIFIYLDKNEDGNLASCMSSFLYVKNIDTEGIWHLQDDVIISSDFKQRTEELDNGLVCGFCCDYDANKRITGVTNMINMWYSFPCIRIPNRLAIECADWYYNGLSHPTEVKFFMRNGKNDDLIFRAFLERHYPGMSVMLVKPNLVNHIDYLIGGSTINAGRRRGKIITAEYWDKPELIEDLKKQLKIDC